MAKQEDRDPELLCDAMLGGLARWLRAAGYDAQFTYGIEDGLLVQRALEMRGVLLSSDGRLFERNLITSGRVKALFVPRELDKKQQLAFVLGKMGLPVRPMPRCMSCGGELVALDKESVRQEAPPRAFASYDRFWRCQRCGKLLWQGTHWSRIARTLESM